MAIDSKLIDCEYEFTGALERPPEEKAGSVAPFFELARADLMVPESQWQARIDADPLQCCAHYEIFNHQGNTHFCVSNALETAMRVVRNKALGYSERIKLSPGSIYLRATGGRQWGGSSLSANLRYAVSEGLLPEDTPENRARFKHTYPQNTWVREGLPDGWRETAILFRLAEYYEVEGTDGFASALIHNMPVWYARSGHSICGMALVRDGGEWMVKYADSYGVESGDGGYRYDRLRNLRSAAYGAYAIRTVTISKLPEAA